MREGRKEVTRVGGGGGGGGEGVTTLEENNLGEGGESTAYRPSLAEPDRFWREKQSGQLTLSVLF